MSNLDKCCRLVHILSQEKIDKIKEVYGDIDYYDNTAEGEPQHGWLMKVETIPCNKLTENGCQFDLEGKPKPQRCIEFPKDESHLSLITTCGFSFVDGERQGSCNRCTGS